MAIMPKQERYWWLLSYFETGQIATTATEDFVNAFIKATNAPHRVMMVGAPVCPMLNADLKSMIGENGGPLKRSRTAVLGGGWRYCYSLPFAKR